GSCEEAGMNRVLIFDPDPVRLASFKQAFGQTHYWVAGSSCALVATTILAKQAFHVCVWCADEAAHLRRLTEAKTAHTWASVVAVSSNPDPAWIVECIRSGARDFWQRSSSIDALVERVDKLAGHGRSEDESDGDDEWDLPFPEF